ncbi:MAG TPA: hypothetical protein H9763_06645 [Candidatus Eisenbergiella merdigallinarum]|uniref:Uncharacterized protein n=1 Tax=Candidatus Eisenbergiella merdigallinarum TaxID=2838552 RepID=A0A9D2SDM7_9FIRM|nr:hypothetical protein [Candidatus Eisenbergiella merdigallinarum]
MILFIGQKIKSILPEILFTVSLIVAILYVFFLFVQQHFPSKVSNINSEEIVDGLIYNIDSIYLEKNNLQINGWALIENEYISSVNTQVLLFNRELNSYASIYTEMVKREDVATAIGTGYDYEYSGFSARSVLKTDSWKNADVYIWYRNNNHSILLDTGLNLSEFQ